jgi:hypothetical protein
MRCKRRTRETGAAKPRTGAHSPEAHSATHGADMHPTSHPADMHSAATEVPTSEAAAMAAAAASECRWRKSKGRAKRTRDEATNELLVHRNSSVVEFAATHAVARRKPPRDPKDAMISNDKCDSF